MMRAPHGPARGLTSSSSRKEASTAWDSFYFFLIAVGYKVPWTAISSLLHQLNQQFQQPKVLLWLNLAYFLPSIPTLLLHSSLQDVLEQWLGVPKAAMARFVVGLGSLTALCLAFPACSSSLAALLAITAAVGVAYSIAFGTSHQLVPRFTQRSTVALNTGFVSCGVVVLLADLTLKPNSANYTPAALQRLFQVAAVQTLVGLLSAALLLRRNWRRLAAAAKQQQHQVIGVLPPTGTGGLLGRVGSGGSGSGSRQLVLPPRGGWGPHAAGAGSGAIGFRHVNQHSSHYGDNNNSSSMMTAGFKPGYGSFSSSPRQQQQMGTAWDMHGGSGSGATPGHGLSVHVTVSSDDGSSGSGGSNSSSSNLALGQVPSGTSHWDLAHSRKQPRNSSSSSKSGGLMQRLQPLLLLQQLAWRIWPAWLALLLSVGSSMLLFPLFTCVDTSGRLGDRLPQILFYARLLGDILGRMVPPAWQLSSSKAVLSAAFLKTKLLVVLVPSILQPSLVGGDLPLAALVALNWWLSGFINTGAYLLAPRLATLEAAAALPGGLGRSGSGSSRAGGAKGGRRWCWGWFSRRARLAATGKDHGGREGRRGAQTGAGGAALGRLGHAALRSKAGAVMSFCFQASCLLGLLAAWLVQEVLHEAGHPAFAGAGKAVGVAAAATAALQAAGIRAKGLPLPPLAAAAAAGQGMADAAGEAAAGLGVVGGFGEAAAGKLGAAGAAFAAAAAAVVRGSPPAA